MKLEYIDGKFILQSTYHDRHLPKSAKFRWDPKGKVWWTDDKAKAAKLGEFADEKAAELLKEHIAALDKAVEESRAIDVDPNIVIPCPDGERYMPFQRAGIAFGLSKDTVLIGDEMGLGKTVQAVGIINADKDIHNVLVICPASLRLNWKRELEKWMTTERSIGIADGKHFPSTKVVIINYDILKKHRAHLRLKVWDIMIADECHYIKNPKAMRTAEVLGKWHKDEAKRLEPIPARRRVYLTGTPIVNRPIEMWPILKSTGLEDFKSWHYYVTRYCAGVKTRWGWDVSGASNLDELQYKLRSQIMVRRLKKDVLTDLPAKQRQVIELPANGCGDTIKAEGLAWDSRKETLAALKAAVEMAKTSDDPADYDRAVAALKEGVKAAFTEMSKLRHTTALAKVPYVVEHLLETVDSSGKVVVFAHHKDVIRALEAALGDADIKSVKVIGDMGAQDRQDAVDDFQNNPDVSVFIGSIYAAGVGLTLTAASHVVFAEIDWVPGQMSQAEDRCHRIGQTDSVLVQHLVLEGSLDAEMARRLVQKQDVIDRALDVKSDSGQQEKAWGSKMGLDEILDDEPEAQTEKKKNTRKEIAKQAEEIKPEEIPEIHEKIRLLESWCDGAWALDGMGFNKFDAPLGHSLAACNVLSPKQAVLAKRLVHKYRRQFEGE